MAIYCAANERSNYEENGYSSWRALPAIVPSVIFKTRVRDPNGVGDNPFMWKDVSTFDAFAGKKVLIFSLPGAFTPTCSTYQLPDFEMLYPGFAALGFDDIYCVSVNDSFVMNKWAQMVVEGGLQCVKVLPDGSGTFTEGMNMLVDKDNLGFGRRSWRYAAVVDNGTITDWFIEEGKEDNCPDDPYMYTRPEYILAQLQ